MAFNKGYEVWSKLLQEYECCLAIGQEVTGLHGEAAVGLLVLSVLRKRWLLRPDQMILELYCYALGFDWSFHSVRKWCTTNRLPEEQCDHFFENQADRPWYLFKMAGSPLLQQKCSSKGVGTGQAQSGYGLTTFHMLTISLLAAVASLHWIRKYYILANHSAYLLATLIS